METPTFAEIENSVVGAGGTTLRLVIHTPHTGVAALDALAIALEKAAPWVRKKGNEWDNVQDEGYRCEWILTEDKPPTV